MKKKTTEEKTITKNYEIQSRHSFELEFCSNKLTEEEKGFLAIAASRIDFDDMELPKFKFAKDKIRIEFVIEFIDIRSEDTIKKLLKLWALGIDIKVKTYNPDGSIVKEMTIENVQITHINLGAFDYNTKENEAYSRTIWIYAKGKTHISNLI